jgi:hypothetical protein
MMCGLNYAILMRALLRLSLRVEILTIGNIRLFLRNLESLDDYFTRFESIVRSLRSRGPLAYSDNERAT